MYGKNKRRQRSVAIQSADYPNTGIEIGPLTTKLCKKAGFRNLLQKAVTVAPHEDARRYETVSLPGGRMSRSIQTTGPEKESAFPHNGSRSLEFGSSRGTVPDMIKIIDRGIANSKPGTSRMTSTAISSMSYLSQLNISYRSTHEGSLAVVCNYDGKTLPNSRSSSLFYYGSQGSRRFSDETVLLIEDYNSYDFTNAAGRRETNTIQERNCLSCCGGKKHRLRHSTNPLTRPHQLSFDDFTEDDDYFVCRICHEGEYVEPLLQPCLCKGSVGCVHGRCLKIWLEQSNTNRCELCNYPYAIKQTKKYSKCVSIRVFFGTIVNKKSLVYDAISFVVITPLTIVGVAMCIQASVSSATGDKGDSNIQMGNITKVGMIMLSATILVAYGVWLYTLISFHYRAWKKWYNNCYDVEVLPVRMTSEEKLEAAQKLNEEITRRQLTREHGSTLVAVIQSPHSTSYSLYQPRQVSLVDNNRSHDSRSGSFPAGNANPHESEI